MSAVVHDLAIAGYAVFFGVIVWKMCADDRRRIARGRRIHRGWSRG